MVLDCGWSWERSSRAPLAVDHQPCYQCCQSSNPAKASKANINQAVLGICFIYMISFSVFGLFLLIYQLHASLGWQWNSPVTAGQNTQAAVYLDSDSSICVCVLYIYHECIYSFDREKDLRVHVDILSI